MALALALLATCNRNNIVDDDMESAILRIVEMGVISKVVTNQRLGEDFNWSIVCPQMIHAFTHEQCGNLLEKVLTRHNAFEKRLFSTRSFRIYQQLFSKKNGMRKKASEWILEQLVNIAAHEQSATVRLTQIADLLLFVLREQIAFLSMASHSCGLVQFLIRNCSPRKAIETIRFIGQKGELFGLLNKNGNVREGYFLVQAVIDNLENAAAIIAAANDTCDHADSDKKKEQNVPQKMMGMKRTQSQFWVSCRMLFDCLFHLPFQKDNDSFSCVYPLIPRQPGFVLLCCAQYSSLAVQRLVKFFTLEECLRIRHVLEVWQHRQRFLLPLQVYCKYKFCGHVLNAIDQQIHIRF